MSELLKAAHEFEAQPVAARELAEDLRRGAWSSVRAALVLLLLFALALGLCLWAASQDPGFTVVN